MATATPSTIRVAAAVPSVIATRRFPPWLSTSTARGLIHTKAPPRPLNRLLPTVARALPKETILTMGVRVRSPT
jgi:hypothetical protein